MALLNDKVCVISGGAGSIGRAAAGVALFLASDLSSYVTGAVLMVDGGMMN